MEIWRLCPLARAKIPSLPKCPLILSVYVVAYWFHICFTFRFSMGNISYLRWFFWEYNSKICFSSFYCMFFVEDREVIEKMTGMKPQFVFASSLEIMLSYQCSESSGISQLKIKWPLLSVSISGISFLPWAIDRGSKDSNH